MEIAEVMAVVSIAAEIINGKRTGSVTTSGFFIRSESAGTS